MIKQFFGYLVLIIIIIYAGFVVDRACKVIDSHLERPDKACNCGCN